MVKRFKSVEGQQLIYDSYDRLLKLWETEFEERDIETDYGKTHIIIAGNRHNPPLLLFHSSGENSAFTWFPNIRDFVKKYYVVAVDYFGGSGKSEPNKYYPKNFDVGIWINRILDVLEIEKTNIAGVSYGGYLSLAYTSKNPERVTRAVCMANYPYIKGIKGYLMFYLLVFRTIKVLFPEILHFSEDNAINILKKFTAKSCSVSAFLNKEITKHWFLELKHSKVIVQKESYFDDFAIKIFKDKALFLLGDSDKLVYHQSVLDNLKINKLNYLILEDTGHVINFEQPEIIIKEIDAFLLS